MDTSIRFLTISILFATLAGCSGSDSSNNLSNAALNAEQTTTTTGNSNGVGNNVATRAVLPVIYIATEGAAAVANTEDYLKATIRIASENGNEVLQASTEIRGRGNTTWGMPKKPYRLKLDNAASLLGMPADRDWALLANYADKSLVRNKLAMNLGEQVGLSYTPRSKFVEFYFNNEYQGIYQLFEHVKAGANRVNVEKLDPEIDTAPAIITGGYFLEIDHRFDEDVCWLTSMSIPICAKDPEFKTEDVADPDNPSSAQFNYIKNYIDAAEQTLSSGNTYEQYFDIEALVNYYLVMELLKNNDAQINSFFPNTEKFTSSVFLFKQRGGKLTFGPLWDFDIAAGNINYNGNEDPEGWFIRNSEWHSRLFANSNFGQRVFSRWCELRRSGVISGLGTQVDTIVAGIDPAAITRNFNRWDILGKQVFANYFIGNTHREETEYLKTWLSTRATWMHTEFVREFGECPANQ